MLRTLFRTLPVAALALLLFGDAQPTTGQSADAADAPKLPPFDQVVKNAKVYEGLFNLYHKEDRLYIEIRPDQFDRPLLAPISIARGVGQGGHTLNFGEQWVLLFKRVGADKVHLIRRNVHFHAKKSAAVAKAVETTYTDSVLMALRIQTINPMKQSVLLNLNDIFMTDFAQLRGGFDASRSTWHKIKAFPENIELQVAATYTGMRGDNVIDSRGATVVVHYGLCKLPDEAYQPRVADDRVGHFLSVVKDFSSDSKETSFVRYVNRWRLERAEPIDSKRPNKLSAPKKKIVFWIEKSVPEEYRTYVREGILEWNKAFEAIGFKDAIEVRQQENLDDFDPEDVRYNTFRWIANDGGYAMGPSRANPLTGEIFDADIVFDASMVRYYRQQAALFAGNTAAAMADDVSPIRAAQRGRDLLAIEPLQAAEALAGWDDRDLKAMTPEERTRIRAIQSGLCQCGPCLKRELSLAAMAVAARDGDKAGDKTSAVEELIGQAIKEVTMHEVGHTLGLRHNFKASTYLKNEDLHNTEITRKKGLVGSVMDYAPVNLAPKGTKQGDYFTTTIGPYDYWAIEYAYKPLTGGTDGEQEELQKIASKSAAPGHDYGTDEDLYGSPDPMIHVWDLGADPMKFGMDRIALAEELLKSLADKGSDKGDSYVKTRQAFNVLMQQYGNGTYMVSDFIGGQVIHRDHKGDANGRDAYEPIKGDKQREALKFLQEHILNDKDFVFSPALLRRLGPDRWMHWGNYRASGNLETPIHQQILAVQRVVLDQALDAQVLSRIQNLALQADKDDKPLTLAEVFRSLTDGIWTDPTGEVKDPKKTIATTVLRRNLQREYVKDLSQLVLGGNDRGGFFFQPARPPADARSLARMHLRDIGKRIDKVLNEKGSLDDATRAHLEECQERISKVLSAPSQANEP